MTDTPGILVQNLYKRYSKVTVLNNINLKLPKGSCFGLLGNNGVGKSTLINILVDLIQSDTGKVELMGLNHQDHPLELRRRMGVLPEMDSMNPDLTGQEQLDFTSLLYGLDPSRTRDLVDSLFSYFFSNRDDLYKRCGTYSTGMKKKLGLIAALLHKPDILLLDEPFSGLDPASSRLVINFINAYKRQDRVILISSHNLSYVDQVSSHIGVLNHGEFDFIGSREEFTMNGREQIEDSLFKILQAEDKDMEDVKRVLES